MSAENKIDIKVAATGGQQAAAEVGQVTQAVTAQTGDIQKIAQSLEMQSAALDTALAKLALEKILLDQGKRSNTEYALAIDQRRIAYEKAVAAEEALANKPHEEQEAAPGWLGGVSIAGAVTAVIGLMKTTAEADAQFRALERSGVQAGQAIDSAMRTNATEAISIASASVQGLQEQLFNIENKTWFEKLKNEVREGFGVKGDTQTKGEIERQAASEREKGHKAADVSLALEKKKTEIAELQAAGRTKEANDKRKQMEFDQKDAELKERFRARAGDNSGQVALKEMQYEKARVELKKQFAAADENEERLRARAAQREIEQKEAAADVRRLRGEGATDEAKKEASARERDREKAEIIDKVIAKTLTEKEADKLRAAADEEHLGRIEEIDRKAKEKYEKEQERIKREADAEAKKTADAEAREQKKAEREQEKEAKQAESDANRLTQAKAGLAIAKEKLAGETIAVKIAEITRGLEKDRADIVKNVAPERRAELIALKEQTAELEKQGVRHAEALRKLTQTPQQKEAERRGEQQARQNDRILASREKNKRENEEANRNFGRLPARKPKAAPATPARHDVDIPPEPVLHAQPDPLSFPPEIPSPSIAVDTQPVVAAQEKGNDQMAQSVAQTVAAALGAVNWAVNLDVSGLQSALTAKLDSLRSDLQAQIDRIGSGI